MVGVVLSPVVLKRNQPHHGLSFSHSPWQRSQIRLGQKSHCSLVCNWLYFAVKFGVAVREIEGENLLFIEKNLRIAAPLLYAMRRNTENGKLYIIMELLPGATLESIWSTLEEQEKLAITSQLSIILQQIRGLPPPHSTYYGSLVWLTFPTNRNMDQASAGPKQGG